MASVPEQFDPVFGDALAGDGGMSDPAPSGLQRNAAVDRFPDALSALPAALMLGVPPAARVPPPRLLRSGPTPGLPPAPAAIAVAPSYRRPSEVVRQRLGPLATSAAAVLAPGGRRPTAGLGYQPPTTTSSAVVRPPAYLPQDRSAARLRAAVQQARGAGGRPPAASPSVVRPAPATGARRKRASTIWSLFVALVIALVSTGIGHQIVHALTELLRRR